MTIRSAMLRIALIACAGGLAAPSAASAAPGDILRQIEGAYSQPCGINTGIAFDGSDLLLTCWSHNVVDRVSTADGALLGTVTVAEVDQLHAVAYDASRELMWTCANFSQIGTVDLATGDWTFVANAPDGNCVDGLAYDGSDDTLYESADVASAVNHLKTDGSLISTNPIGGLIGDCGNSGIAVGGEKLYLANNGCQEVYEVDKDFSASTLFFSFPRRLEDMECDSQTFDPQDAMWVQDAFDRTINAVEMPEARCVEGGGAKAISLEPGTATNFVGTDHTVTATVVGRDGPEEGVEVKFEVVAGPNAGLTGTDTTDAEGKATFTYSSAQPGTDTIVASFVNARGATVTSEPVTKHWVDRAGTFSCRATALRLGAAETAVANPPDKPCRDDAKTALGQSLGALGSVGVLNARTDSRTAHADAANVRLLVGATAITVTVLEADAEVGCREGDNVPVPVLSGSSRIASLKVGTRTIPVGSNPVTVPLGIATLYLNRQTVSGGRLTQRALFLDSALLPKVVIGEAQANAEGNPCGTDGV